MGMDLSEFLDMREKEKSQWEGCKIFVIGRLDKYKRDKKDFIAHLGSSLDLIDKCNDYSSSIYCLWSYNKPPVDEHEKNTEEKPLTDEEIDEWVRERIDEANWIIVLAGWLNCPTSIKQQEYACSLNKKNIFYPEPTFEIENSVYEFIDYVNNIIGPNPNDA